MNVSTSTNELTQNYSSQMQLASADTRAAAESTQASRSRVHRGIPEQGDETNYKTQLYSSRMPSGIMSGISQLLESIMGPVMHFMNRIMSMFEQTQKTFDKMVDQKSTSTAGQSGQTPAAASSSTGTSTPATSTGSNATPTSAATSTTAPTTSSPTNTSTPATASPASAATTSATPSEISSFGFPSGIMPGISQLLESVMGPVMHFMNRIMSMFEQMQKTFDKMVDQKSTSTAGQSGQTPAAASSSTGTSTPAAATGSSVTPATASPTSATPASATPTGSTATGATGSTTPAGSSGAIESAGKCGCKDKSKILNKAPKGFLWKPISDSDKKLAVLLPRELSKRAKSAIIYKPDGSTIIEKGRFGGIGNGDRAHFRFKQPGASYPPGSIVAFRMDDGSETKIRIANTSKRVE